MRNREVHPITKSSAAGATALASRRALIAAAIVGVVALSWIASRNSTSSQGIANFLADLCLTAAPPEAHSLVEKPDRVFAVVVPLQTPEDPLSKESRSAAQGEIVQYHVKSNQTGAVAVHGLLDPVPVEAGQSVTVAFKAIYSGRFPLHFHGADGSHFEVIGLDIFPGKLKTAGAGDPQKSNDEIPHVEKN